MRSWIAGHRETKLKKHLLFAVVVVLASLSTIATSTTPPARGSGVTRLSKPYSFKLKSEGWGFRRPLVRSLANSLPVVTPAAVAADGNRKAKRLSSVDGVQHLHIAFTWNKEDREGKGWYPQGITGTADAFAGQPAEFRRHPKMLLVSWYRTRPESNGQHKGSRIAFIDMRNLNRIRYRFALLVDPIRSSGGITFKSVESHVGGIVWYRDYLYVADTLKGLRVFSMKRIMRVSTGNKSWIGRHGGKLHAHNYKYIIPQVGKYVPVSSSAKLRHSFLSLDSSTAPLTLLSGEYGNTSARLSRWDLASTGLLASSGNRATPRDIWISSHDKMNGAFRRNGVFFLASSQQRSRWGNKFGMLYRARVGHRSVTANWANGPEDLHYSPTSDNLWSLTEYPKSWNNRVKDRRVFAVKLADYD